MEYRNSRLLGEKSLYHPLLPLPLLFFLSECAPRYALVEECLGHICGVLPTSPWGGNVGGCGGRVFVVQIPLLMAQ